MQTLVLLLILGIVDQSISQNYSQFKWLSYLRGRWRHAAWQAVDVDCPLECDCPSTFPTAMFCQNRNLQHVPYVPSYIKYVYLHRNKITGIKDGVFDNATSLIWVVLFQNQLDSDKIGKNVFSKLKQLDRLLLDHNELTRMPPNLPNSITDLRLGHNKISKIPSNSFEGMANLTTLELQANVIEDVGGMLKGLKALTLLDMKKNKLSKIPDHLPERLQQLYLDFNKIQSVPAGFLTMNPRLQFVRLAHNKLTDKGLPSNVFNVSTLVELDLSFNKLEKIPVVSRNLENLYLQANKIKDKEEQQSVGGGEGERDVDEHEQRLSAAECRGGEEEIEGTQEGMTLTEFSLSSFCNTIDMTNFSSLRMLRLDANEISAKDIPAEAPYCLRHVGFIEV